VKIVSFPEFLPYKIRKIGFGFLSTILKTIYILNKKYEIVQSDGHLPSSVLPCIIHRLFFGSKYIVEWWDFFGNGGMNDLMPWWYKISLGKYNKWAEIHSKKKTDGVIVLSDFTKKRALEIGISKNKILILHGGADIESIKYIDNKYNRGKYGLPSNSLIFCTIGINDMEVDDIKPFLLAFNELKNQYDIKWFSTGNRLSKDIIKRYEIGNEYYEFGWVNYSEYSELLSCADVFLCLLENTNINKARWPNKLGDYFASGRMIMANCVGEQSGYIDRYPNSFIKVDWDQDSIKHKIVCLTSKTELISSGKKNRKIAEIEIAWFNKAIILEKYYMGIINTLK
jgi:hypothetical protein